MADACHHAIGKVTNGDPTPTGGFATQPRQFSFFSTSSVSGESLFPQKSGTQYMLVLSRMTRVSGMNLGIPPKETIGDGL